jgi:CubicO group peptidase (beta-lactamase class C family)
MILEEEERDRLKCPGRRGDLFEHVDAVAILLDHPLKPTNLTLYPSKSPLDVVDVLAVAAFHFGPPLATIANRGREYSSGSLGVSGTHFPGAGGANGAWVLTAPMANGVEGRCEPGYGEVLDAFCSNFADRGELGAAITVVRHGRVVVDIWGGFCDDTRSKPWDERTMANFYSAGKPLVATLLLREIETRELELDTPIVELWPEFGCGGKDTATIRHALCHRAGVPAIRRTLSNEDLWDWDTMVAALAETSAWFAPGSRHVYHTNTYGHLVGELARRMSGTSPHALLADLAGELDADVHFGVDEDDLDRCADIVLDAASSPAILPADDGGEGSMIRCGYFNPPGYSSFGVVNSVDWRTSQIPSTNGHGTARGLAAFYGALLVDGKILSPRLLEEATAPQSIGHCPVLGEEVTFGLGFQPSTPRRQFGRGPTGFGHFGTGGAVGFADPESGIALGYVMNHVIPRWQSTRNRALIDAVYRSL